MCSSVRELAHIYNDVSSVLSGVKSTIPALKVCLWWPVWQTLLDCIRLFAVCSLGHEHLSYTTFAGTCHKQCPVLQSHICYWMPLGLGGNGWECDACILPGLCQKNARVVKHDREILLEVILRSFWVGGNYLLNRQQPKMEPKHTNTQHKAGECHVCRNVQVYFH